MSPLISIISVNLNDRAGLSRTLASIGRQALTDREVIVVDGGSTDGSVELIRESAPIVTDWLSEKDAGIFDAMNKGIRRARGAYCVFMNGGDAFASDDALERFFAAGDPVEDILYSDAIVQHEDGSTQRCQVPETIDWDFLMRTNLPHQSTALRRDLFDRVGFYDTHLRMCADYEFFLRAIVVRGATTRRVPVPLAIQVWGGFSSRPETFPLLREERRLSRQRALSPVLLAHWERYLAAKRGFMHHTIRNAFRPVARHVRAWSRRVRGKPDSPI